MNWFTATFNTNKKPCAVFRMQLFFKGKSLMDANSKLEAAAGFRLKYETIPLLRTTHRYFTLRANNPHKKNILSQPSVYSKRIQHIKSLRSTQSIFSRCFTAPRHESSPKTITLNQRMQVYALR